MDKVISTRVEESAAELVGQLARHLRTTKKRVLEEAIRHYASHVSLKEGDVFEQTSGAWKRTESASELVRASRQAFADAMARRRA